MQAFYTLSPEPCDSAVALGFFDGVHRGHRRVLKGAAQQRVNGFTPVCLTFAESPKAILTGCGSPALMTPDDKLRALKAIGIEHVYFADFRAVMHLSARDFFRDILVGTLRAKKLFCGFNYRFGKNAEGDAALLQTLCDSTGISLMVVPPETDHGETICSTLIKQLITDGNIRRANQLLCGRFGVCETICRGKRLGHSLGTPTINQPLTKGLVVPKFGVYASAVTLKTGEQYGGVTNIGIKPTVGNNVPLWETWMPDYHGGELYGQTADVRLLDFIREERRFDTLEALQAEIIRNGQQAKEIYRCMLHDNRC